MKAIITKYHEPTNFKGSRISASAEGGDRIYISYPHELSGDEVADALCKKLNWCGKLIAGSGLHGEVIFVFDGPVWDSREHEYTNVKSAAQS